MITVIGGGIAGLTAGYVLGDRAIVHEAGSRPGGVMGSRREKGFLIENGPRSIAESPFVSGILEDLGLTPLLPSCKARFVLRDGKVTPAPRALSATGILRAAVGIGYRPKPRIDESIASYTTRRFGREAYERLFDAIITGIYAGDSERLAVEEAFPAILRRGPKKRIISFAEGLGTLVDALAARCELSLGSRIEVIDPSKGPVIFSAPAHTAARFEWKINGSIEPLAKIRYAPVTTVTLGYPAGAVGRPVNGFGFLVPRIEKKELLGVLSSSATFPSHAPEGHHLLTAFFRSEPRMDELYDILGITGDPVLSIVTVHEKAIPQYEIGYREIRLQLDELEKRNPGLIFAGSYRAGVSVGETMKSGFDAAQRVR